MADLDHDLLQRGRLSYAWSASIATITLNRPEIRNAQLPETWEALSHIGSRLPDDTRVVVVKGAGSSFSAGLDRSLLDNTNATLANIAGAPNSIADGMIAEFQGGFSWLADPSFVSIAAVHGHAVGAGFQLALACDVVIAADDAQFAMAEVMLGLVPDLGGTGALVRAVGRPRALEICVTGRRVGAAEAERIGLALLVVPAADLDGTVADLCSAILSNDAEAVRAVTRLIGSAVGAGRSDQLAAERREQVGRLRALGAHRP